MTDLDAAVLVLVDAAGLATDGERLGSRFDENQDAPVAERQVLRELAVLLPGEDEIRIDVLACPRCGGRMVVLATIDDPALIAQILTHLGLALAPGEPALGRAPPEDGPVSA